jgi:DNA-binding PadR family transcriptional regulator
MPTVLPELDNTIHAPVRLAIMTALTLAESADFMYLRKITDTSDGNLATHLRRLEEAGYVEMHKSFRGRRPNTAYRMSAVGRTAFMRYLEHLHSILPPSPLPEIDP